MCNAIILYDNARVGREEQRLAGCSVQLLQKDSCVGRDARCGTGAGAEQGRACAQPREVGVAPVW